MNQKERFIVEGLGYWNRNYLDPFDKNAMQRDRERAQRIKAIMPAYYVVTMSTGLTMYEYKPTGMLWDEYNKKIKALKPKTNHMNMTFFRIKDYTPLGKTGGFFTAPKCTIPSLKLETLDGRTIEGYSEYIKAEDGRQYVVLSDALLNETKKNFVHPKLNLNNFGHYVSWTHNDDDNHPIYYGVRICTKQEAAQMYGRWKEGRQSLKEHFDRMFENEAKKQREERAKQQQQAAQNDRYMNQFDKDFGF